MMKQLLSDMLEEEEATIAIELQQKTFGPLLVQADIRARLLRQLIATCKTFPRPTGSSRISIIPR